MRIAMSATSDSACACRLTVTAAHRSPIVSANSVWRSDAIDARRSTHHRGGSDSVGNRLADYQANLSRNCKHGHGTPVSLVELPLHECERHMHMMDDRDGHGMQIINDMRSSANKQLRALMLSHWKGIDNQGAFACDGMIELGRVIMSNANGGHGSSSLHQSTLVHVATNSLHYYFPAARGSRLTELVCACGAICTISHLQACNIDRHHAQLHRSIITYLSTTSCSPAWLIKNTGTTMSSMMSSLFPTPHTLHHTWRRHRFHSRRHRHRTPPHADDDRCIHHNTIERRSESARSRRFERCA